MSTQAVSAPGSVQQGGAGAGRAELAPGGQPAPTALRRFQLHRREDVSGVSGVGIVAEGVQFHDGRLAMSWLSHHHTVALYDCVESLLDIHGHGGRTTLCWLDPAPPGVPTPGACPLPPTPTPATPGFALWLLGSLAGLWRRAVRGASGSGLSRGVFSG